MQLIFRLLEHNPNGLAEREIEEELRFGRRNVNNYLHTLENEGKVYKEEGTLLWFALPYHQTRLQKIELTSEEAMTLYLATRLLVKQHDKRNESAEMALDKLAEALTHDVGVGQEIRQAALELAQRPGDAGYSRIFRIVMQAYIYRRKLQMIYEPLNGKPFETLFAPYLLEPSAIGYATYIIGHSSIVDALRTYKLERIQSATLTREEYNVPEDFPGLEYLRSAWNIISGETLIPVKVRFRTARVASRVRESVWHPSQTITDDPENPAGCIWSAQIADLTDFRPWLRSWGSDAEVLEPAELREEIEQEVKKLAWVYGVGIGEPVPLYMQLWAKTDQTHQTDKIHTLVHHMLDVAQVTAALWDRVFPESTRQYFATKLGMEVSVARQWLAFIAGLHDLGKACPAFQGLHASSKVQFTEQGLTFPDIPVHIRTPHGWVTTYALRELLVGLGLDKKIARHIAYTVGGHHGVFPNAKALEELGPSRRGDGQWEAVRQDLFKCMIEHFDVRSLPLWPRQLSEDSAFWSLLAGMVAFADWIGSIETYFFNLDAPNLPTYSERAYKKAVTALETLGWTGYTPPSTGADFQSLFNFIPRPLQAAVEELSIQLTTPALVIIEAPTGEGKTEAALYLADHWAYTTQQRGMYVAMPTMATSNQMLGRVRRFLEHRYLGQQVDLHLLHGNAAWSDEMEALRLAAVNEDIESTVVAHSWFQLNKKRSLLAPFAVGTVDQVLLSVLQTKHFFVRLFGLSHKTIIFDEVHAYDTYMSTLLEHLLRWLSAMGTTVILLSATLPAETRRALMEAYIDREFDRDVDYPAITWATAEADGVYPIATSFTSTRTFALEYIDREPEVLVSKLDELLSEGGCAAVICNTVARAQIVYRALREADIVPDANLILFHARFPFGQRAQIENLVLRNLGPNVEQRPSAIIVATQVIEQSLDLDFDVMISDLAPIDLLLQRAGRLHRHRRASRPTRLSNPRFFITIPDMQNNLPVWGNDGKIYEPYILLRTYLTLEGREGITVPHDTQVLIANVYNSPECLVPVTDTVLAQALERTYDEMIETMELDTLKARKNLIAAPDDEVLRSDNRQLDEDNPELHETWRALTRLTRPTVTLVCLHQQEDSTLTTDRNGGQSVSLAACPTRDMTKFLVQQTVSVSTYPVVKYFLAQESPSGWQDHALLRYYRAAIFIQGRCDAGEYELILDPREGLLIQKKEV
ncbi:MAG: CRISPR-associated helicase Cas3' [Anaerolineae bacterium]|nr:CRISPR-associated helicase Cas3' [Anaerolineae bacterium]